MNYRVSGALKYFKILLTVNKKKLLTSQLIIFIFKKILKYGDSMIHSQAEMFKILGVENRIRIIELLKKSGPLGVNELSDNLKISPSAVSQHLKTLRHAGLVRSERKGYWIPYKINEKALEQCHDLLSDVCSCGCKGTGRVRDGELETADDKLALLKRWEKELQKELAEVRKQIKTLPENE